MPNSPALRDHARSVWVWNEGAPHVLRTQSGGALREREGHQEGVNRGLSTSEIISIFSKRMRVSEP
eukprot:1175764-Prorocentrum_minimum.AAC.3